MGKTILGLGLNSVHLFLVMSLLDALLGRLEALDHPVCEGVLDRGTKCHPCQPDGRTTTSKCIETHLARPRFANVQEVVRTLLAGGVTFMFPGKASGIRRTVGKTADGEGIARE